MHDKSFSFTDEGCIETFSPMINTLMIGTGRRFFTESDRLQIKNSFGRKFSFKKSFSSVEIDIIRGNYITSSGFGLISDLVTSLSKTCWQISKTIQTRSQTTAIWEIRERDVLVNYPLVLFIDTPSLSDMINSKIGTISIHSNYGVKEQLFIELNKSKH